MKYTYVIIMDDMSSEIYREGGVQALIDTNDQNWWVYNSTQFRDATDQACLGGYAAEITKEEYTELLVIETKR